jgi:alkylated DNA repair dioxygenase AlkB
MPVKCVTYEDNFLPASIGKDAFQNIMKEVQFMTPEESAIMMMGKRIEIPRKQCGYGDVETYYRFTGVKVDAGSWTPTLKKIRDHIFKRFNVPVNFVLVNLYVDGKDYIGWHSDDEGDLCKTAPIFSLSLGATRDFQLRHKVSGQTFEQPLRSNSMTVMYPPCQRAYKHQIPKRLKVKDPRLNLTFRVMKTAKGPSSYRLFQIEQFLNVHLIPDMVGLVLYYLEANYPEHLLPSRFRSPYAP